MLSNAKKAAGVGVTLKAKQPALALIKKSCDVDCKQGSKSITCSGGGCGCYCDADGKPTCECTKGGHKK